MAESIGISGFQSFQMGSTQSPFSAINAAINGLVKVTTIDLTATGVKTLTVTFNQPVDPDVANFAVVKGASTAIAISDIAWNDDKTVAELTLASKLTEATYTVNVTGVEEGTLTDSVTTETEVVSSIEIPSNVAVLQADASIKVAYKILNQYGEDITAKTTSGVTYDATKGGLEDADEDAGIVTIAAAGDYFVEGDTLTLTIVHTATGTVATQKLTVSETAGIASIAYGAVYNADDLALSQDNNAEDFYLPVVAKDQFGNTLTSADFTATSAVLTTTDADVIDAALTDFSELDINDDGVDETVLKLTVGEAGTATLKLVSLYDGAKYPVTLTVAEPTQVDKITLTQPELAVVGEKTVIPFEAIDTNGEAVTSLAELNDAVNGVDFTVALSGGLVNGLPTDANATFKKNAATGVVELILDLTNVVDDDNDGGYANIIATTATDETTTLKVTVEEAAVATAITGLDDVTLNPVVDGTSSLDFDEVIVTDQFDRVMDAADVAKAVIIDIDDLAYASVDDASLTVGETATFTGEKKGTTAVTFTLDGVADSDYTTNIKVAATSEFASYELSTIGTIYDDAAIEDAADASDTYNESLTVYGVTSGGTKVVLPAADYNVVFTGQTGLLATASTNKTLIGVVGTSSSIVYPTDVKEATATAVVTINATGEKLNQTITTSKANPTVAKIVMDTDDVVSGGYDLSTATFTAANIVALIDATESLDNFGEVLDFATPGVATFVAENTTPVYITITDLVDSDDDDGATIANNGTTTAGLTGLETGDSFTVTITADGVSTSFVVAVTISQQK